MDDDARAGQQSHGTGIVGGGVAVGVQDVRPIPADQGEQVGGDPGTESVPAQTQGSEALALQVGRGLIRRADADQAELELGAIEPGEPPAEQPGHAVGARAPDPELVA